MEESKEVVTLYSAEGCAPCEDIDAGLESGNYEVLGVEGEVEIVKVDLANEDNYHLIDEQGVDAIPSAQHGTETCAILISDETGKVTFDCRPTEEQGTPVAEETDR